MSKFFIAYRITESNGKAVNGSVELFATTPGEATQIVTDQLEFDKRSGDDIVTHSITKVLYV
jgi:hypothetical protein